MIGMSGMFILNWCCCSLPFLCEKAVVYIQVNFK